MRLDAENSIDREKAVELLEKDFKEFKEEVRDRKLRENDLKKLIKAERKGKDRDDFLDFIVRYSREEKVLRELDGFIEQISRVDSVLEKIVEKEGEAVEIDTEEIVGKTVRDLRKHLKNSYLTGEELEKILDAEKDGKDRKTAKKSIKREIENAEPPADIKEVQSKISGSEESVRKFKKEFIYHPGKFDLQIFENSLEDALKEDLSEEENDTEESSVEAENEDKSPENSGENKEKDIRELIELTGEVVQSLKRRDSLDNREELKDLANDAFLALEAENYSTFRNRIKELRELAGSGGETDSNRLEGIEDVIRSLEENSQVLEKEKEGSDPEVSSAKVSEREPREVLISELADEGFDRENLRTRSTSDLKKLMQSTEKVDELESAFENSDSESHEETDGDEGSAQDEEEEESSDEEDSDDDSEPGKNLGKELEKLEASLKSSKDG